MDAIEGREAAGFDFGLGKLKLDFALIKEIQGLISDEGVQRSEQMFGKSTYDLSISPNRSWDRWDGMGGGTSFFTTESSMTMKSGNYATYNGSGFLPFKTWSLKGVDLTLGARIQDANAPFRQFLWSGPESLGMGRGPLLPFGMSAGPELLFRF